MSESNCLKLAKSIIAGRRIKRGDDLSIFLTAPLPELQEGARLLQDHFCGNHIDFCTIINGRSGRCGEDCKYCAQAAQLGARQQAVRRAEADVASRAHGFVRLDGSVEVAARERAA